MWSKVFPVAWSTEDFTLKEKFHLSLVRSGWNGDDNHGDDKVYNQINDNHGDDKVYNQINDNHVADQVDDNMAMTAFMMIK